MHREERSSTAFKPMPHISTYGGSHFSNKHNSNKLEADGFMKLGDIRGEFSPSREADSVSDQVAQFTTGGGGDSLTDAGLGNNSAISCEDGDIRVGQFGEEADALTNYQPVGARPFFSELVQGSSIAVLELDKSSSKYNPGKGASLGTEKAEGWIIIESIVNQNNVQRIDTEGMGIGIPGENFCIGYCFDGDFSEQENIFTPADMQVRSDNFF